MTTSDNPDSTPPAPVPPVCEHFMIRVDKAAGLVTCSKCGKEFEMFTGQPFHFPKHVLPSGAALFHRTDLPLQPKATPVSATPPESETQTYWLIKYEDSDHPDEIFTDETAARKTLAARLVSWACHLFVSVNHVSALEARALAAERERDEAREKLRKAMATLKRIGCNQSRYFGSEAMNMFNELSK